MTQSPEATTETLTVLLVDDRLENLISLAATLESGHRLLMASSGEEALELLLKHDIALVLLDVQMPGLDGYEVARLMRGNPRTRHIPIIFITAVLRDEAAVLRGYEAGAIDFLTKPFSSLMLRNKVDVLLALEQSRRRLDSMNQALAQERAYYASILSTAAEGILVVGEDGLIRYANPSACRLLDTTAARLTDQPILTVLPLPEGVWERSELFRYWQRGETYRLHDVNLRTPAGTSLPVMLSGAPLPPPHQGLVLVFQDNSVSKRLQEQLQRQAITDSLTGLRNRHGFLQALQSALARARRNGKVLSVLYMDLDGFKRINDAFGHQAGDAVLRAVSDRLRHVLRPYDTLARLGGDEFTVVLDSLEAAEDSALIADKILEVLQPPHEVNGLKLTVGASIGIATWPDCGDSVEQLVQAADTAMYRAKSEGRNQHRFFTQEMNGRARARLLLEESLRQAIAGEEFQLYYQPQIRLADGGVRGFEALLRWQHRTAGTVAPHLFVPALEDTGLINQLGPWLLAQACRQAGAWAPTLPPSACIALNLSPQQFASRDLVADVAQALERFNLVPAQLELEVTERSLIVDLEYTRQVLQQLRALGVRLAIDDFGTGYSSLAYLKQFEIDVLKIDRIFIANSQQSSKDAAIAQSIIQLGHNLGLEIIAEGVETPAQLAWLQAAGCDTVQGFIFAEALELAAAMRFPATVTLPPPSPDGAGAAPT